MLVGSLVTHGRPMDDLVEAVLVGLAAGAAALAASVVALALGDSAMMAEVLQRGRARRHRKEPA